MGSFTFSKHASQSSQSNAGARKSQAVQDLKSFRLFGKARPSETAILQIEYPDAFHNSNVKLVIETEGIAARQIHFSPVFNRLRNFPDTAEQYVVYNVADSIHEVSDKLLQVMQSDKREIKVINISYSASSLGNYLGLFERYNEDAEFARQTRETLGIPDGATSAEQTQAIFSYVDQVIANHPEIKAALLRYQQVTQAAAEKGFIVVVAAGNGQDKVQGSRSQGYELSESAAYNFLARSASVISVAAADTDEAAFDGYCPAAYSAKGDYEYYPTLAAEGTNPNGIEGTSYAAPKVAAAVARMLQESPELSFEQVKAILQSTALASIEAGPLFVGAGLLQPELAVEASKKLVNLNATR